MDEDTNSPIVCAGGGCCGGFGENAPCEICKPTNARDAIGKRAVSRCLDCVKLLCRRCVDLHRRTKVTQAHSVFDLDVSKDIACKTHMDEVVRYYCESCEMCICVVCTFHEHKTHDVFSFSESLERCTLSLQPLVARCRERVEEARRQLDIIHKCEKEMKLVEEQIRDSIIESMADIRRQERNLIQNIPNAFGEEGAKFIREKDYLQEVIDGLQDAQAVADMLIKEQSVELLFVRRDVEEKLRILLQRRLRSIPDKISNSPIKFIPKFLHVGFLQGNEAAQQQLIAATVLDQSICNSSVQTEATSVSDQATMTISLRANNDLTSDDQVMTTSDCPEDDTTECSKQSDIDSDADDMSSSLSSRASIARSVSSSDLAEKRPENCISANDILSLLEHDGALTSKNFNDDTLSTFLSQITSSKKSLKNYQPTTNHIINNQIDEALIGIVANKKVVGFMSVPLEIKNKFLHLSSFHALQFDGPDTLCGKEELKGIAAESLSQTTNGQRYCDRSSSPVATFLLGNCTDQILNDNSRVKNSPASFWNEKFSTKDTPTNTDKVSMADKSCSPIRILHPSVGVSATCTMCEQCTMTPRVGVSDAEVTAQPTLVDHSTSMPTITFLTKETSTPVVHLMHKNMGTDNLTTCDKQTSTIDVTAGYKDAVTRKGLIYVNRGTNTTMVVMRTRETSPPPVSLACVDRASSPVKITMVDKGISAKKGEILEPIDVFFSPGKGVTKAVENIRRSATSSPRSPKPKLESIQEDSVEQHVAEEEPSARPTMLSKSFRNSLPFIGGHYAHALNRSPRRISDPLGKAYEEGNVLAKQLFSRQEERVFFPPSFNLNDTKSANFEKSRDNEKMQDEGYQTLSTSTPPATAERVIKVKMEDKAVSTDSLPIEGKMAACINKLKTVQQRLEQQPLTSPLLANSLSYLHDRSADSSDPCIHSKDDCTSSTRIKSLDTLAKENPQVYSLVSPIAMRRFPLSLRPQDVMTDSSDSERAAATATAAAAVKARSPKTPLSKRRKPVGSNSIAEQRSESSERSELAASSSKSQLVTSSNESVATSAANEHKGKQPLSSLSSSPDNPVHPENVNATPAVTKQNPGVISPSNVVHLKSSRDKSIGRGVKELVPNEVKAPERSRKLSPFRMGGQRSPVASPAPQRKTRGLGFAHRLFSAATGKTSGENISTKSENEQKGSHTKSEIEQKIGILKKFHRT